MIPNLILHLLSVIQKNARNKTYAPLSFSSQMQRFHGFSTPHIYMLKPFTQNYLLIHGNGTNTDT